MERIKKSVIALHDSEIVDLDDYGDLDIPGKPYDGDAPRLDIWLQNGTGRRAGTSVRQIVN